MIETELYRAGMEPMLGFFHQPAYGRPSLMLDLLEEFRPLVNTLVLRLINRRQLGPGDFQRRGSQSVEELLAESAPAPDPPDAHARAGAGEQDSESPDADISAVPPWEDSCAASEVPAPRPPPGDVSLPEAPQAGPQSQDGGEVVGVFLSDLGRKIFLSEVLRRLRERLYYPPRDASLELREVVRQQVFHMARVVQGKDLEYVPFTTE